MPIVVVHRTLLPADLPQREEALWYRITSIAMAGGEDIRFADFI